MLQASAIFSHGELMQNLVCEMPCQLQIGDVVEKSQRLQGRVGAIAFHGAGSPIRSVEIHKAGIGRASPPKHVEAPAIPIRALTRFVNRGIAADVSPDIRRLRWVDRRTSLMGCQNACDSQGVISKGFGRKSVSIGPRKPSVGGVGPAVLRLGDRGLTVGGRKKKLSMDGLH